MLELFSRKKTEPSLTPEEEFTLWLQKGKPAPPPHFVKQKAIDEYRIKYNLETLVETGTYLGDMVEERCRNFQTIYSIKLSKKIFSKARKRFSGRHSIRLRHSDSGKVLSKLIAELQQPDLFWLDGHYTGGMTAFGEKECPVAEELKAIFSSRLTHFILIDDARLFTGKNNYPSVTELEELIKTAGKKIQLRTIDDIIRITPI